MIIAIDFDGTIVTHEYPRIGKLAPLAKEVINELAAAGHKMFLWTMRDNEKLEEALAFLEDEGIPIKTGNRSPAQFSASPKQYAHIYIDDTAVGVPLQRVGDAYTTNWPALAYIFMQSGVISKEAYERITKASE